MELSYDAGYLLWQLHHHMHRSVEAALTELRLTLPQFAALTHLYGEPGLSSADLARLLHLTPQAVSLLISRLEGAGYVTRAAAKVGRSQPLKVTAAGRRALASAKPAVASASRKVFGPLDADELDTMRAAFGRCLAAAGYPVYWPSQAAYAPAE